MPDTDQSTDAGPLGMAALAECPHCGTRILPLPGRLCPACRRHLDATPDRSAVRESSEVLAAGRKMARRLFRDGLSFAEVTQNLIERGVQPASVTRIVLDACAEQVEWYQIRGWKSIVVGARCLIGSVLATLATFKIWGETRDGLTIPALLALTTSGGLIAHGIRLRRRAAEFAPPRDPAMKSGSGPVDTRGDYLD